MRLMLAGALAGAALLSLALGCSNGIELEPPGPDSSSVGGSGSQPPLDPAPPPLLTPPPACVPAPVDHPCALVAINFHTSSAWPAVEAYRLRIGLDDGLTYSCSLTRGARAADECQATPQPFSVHYDSDSGAVTIDSVLIDRPGRQLHLELGPDADPRWIVVDQVFTWVPASPCDRCTDGGHVTPASLEVTVPEQPPASPAPPDAGGEPGDASTLGAPDATSDAGAP